MWELILTQAEDLAHQLTELYGPGVAATILHIAANAANSAVLMKMVDDKLAERAVEIPLGGFHGKDTDD
jgi:hypothetical protein